MHRFLAPEYHLPSVEAILPGQELGDSANKPLVITCLNGANGQRGDYVVKLKDAERMHAEAQMREVLASFMAMEMDIPTPEPAAVNIGSDLVEAAMGSWHYQRLSKSKGINFGSSLLGHAPEVSIHAILNATQAKDAQHVLSFDILLRHFDRRADRPNLLSDGERLYVIDHELAFGFVFDLFPNRTPWVLNEGDLRVLPNHLLYHKVKQSAFNVQESVERLERLNDAFWNKAWSELPDEWRCDQFDRIKEEITLVREHSEEFYERLKHQLP